MDALKSKGQMFDQVNLGEVNKSGFDLTFYNKGTGKIGQLIPTRVQETLPGDKFTGSSSAAVQFEPLAVPILSNMDVRQEHFFVPNRILWNKWEEFITGGEDMTDTSTPPIFTLSKVIQAFNNIVCNDSYSGFFSLEIREGLFEYNNDQAANSYILPSETIISTDYDKQAFEEEFSNIGASDLVKPLAKRIDAYIKTLMTNNVQFTEDPDGIQSQPGQGIPMFAMDGTSQVLTMYLAHDGNGGKTDTELIELIGQEQFEMDVYSILKRYVVNHGELSLKYVPYIPYFSKEFVEVLRALYDIYSFVIGTSSVLDYMNAPRVKFSDFLVICYCTISDYFYEEVETGGVDPGTKNWKYITGNYAIANYTLFSQLPINALPFRALYLIWYNYYRDQLLEKKAPKPLDGDTITVTELITLLLPRRRCWRKDTFTTALSDTGTGSVVVPVNASVKTGALPRYYDVADSSNKATISMENMALKEFTLTDGTKLELPSRYIEGLSSSRFLGADTMQSTGFSLDLLNRAQRMQKWLVKNLIYGNRIQDSLYSHFGVKSSDARLNLPEYIAGSRSLVNLDTIVNNTTVENTIAGDKAANAYGYDKGETIDKYCEEHGVIISLFTIMPEPTYSYSVSRLYNKVDKFDYAWPEFAQIGMDAVYNSELMASGSLMSDDEAVKVFGYQGRYYDYKTKQDEEHGELQTTQNMYTFSREFNPYKEDEKPKLNYEFVHCWPSLDMFVAEGDDVDLIRYDIKHALGVSRCLPVCGTNL